MQGKRYWQKITPTQIRDFIGAMNGVDVEVGYFVTASGFTKAAREAAMRSSYQVHLVDGRELGHWQNQMKNRTHFSAKVPKGGKRLLLMAGTVLVWCLVTGIIYGMGTQWLG